LPFFRTEKKVKCNLLSLSTKGKRKGREDRKNTVYDSEHSTARIRIASKEKPQLIFGRSERGQFRAPNFDSIGEKKGGESKADTEKKRQRV